MSFEIHSIKDEFASFNWRAETAVFTSGITSMGLEVLAARIIAPVFGNSVYTWGGILGVFMVSLSLGYWLGGKRATDHASKTTLSRILIYSAIAVGFTAATYKVIVQLSAILPLPTIYAPIIPITFLFGPAMFLLGFISPYAAELSTVQSTGEASGRVYTLGSIGSVFGAFVTTYALMPYVPVLWIQVLFAGILLIVAISIGYPPSRNTLIRVGAALLLIFSAIGYTPAVERPGNTVYETQTPYQHLRIADHNGVRIMYLNGHPQSAMYLDNQKDGYVWDYPAYAHLPYLYRPPDSIDRILVIGGAGFSMPKRFLAEYPNVTVDVVEIDPEVVHAAKKYFNVSESKRLNIYIGDGRQFLRTTNHTYDVIILDAYQKNNIPFHLTTIEFMRLVFKRLDDRGVFIANVISSTTGPRSKFMRSVFKTVKQPFPSAEIYPTGTYPKMVHNVLVVATKGPNVTQAKLLQRSQHRSIGINLTKEVTHHHGPGTISTENVPILRDGKAPVNRLTAPLSDQRYVIQNLTTPKERPTKEWRKSNVLEFPAMQTGNPPPSSAPAVRGRAVGRMSLYEQ